MLVELDDTIVESPGILEDHPSRVLWSSDERPLQDDSFSTCRESGIGATGAGRVSKRFSGESPSILTLWERRAVLIVPFGQRLFRQT